MKLTENTLKRYLQIEGLTFTTLNSLVGTSFCKMEHNFKEAINDVNDWLLEYFPSRVFDITQGFGYVDDELEESNKYYICVTLDSAPKVNFK